MEEGAVEDLKFFYFCKLCEKVRSQKSKQKGGEILRKFIDYGMKGNSSFFPILRLLLPQLDRERGAYGVKETNLAKTYKRILGLASNSSEAKMLTNFTSPSAASSGAMGDFAEVLSCILRNRCGEGNEMSIRDVNKCLDNIALKHAEHDPRAVDDEYTEMINKMSNLEQKWIVRIILKSLDLGIGHKKILSTYHPDAFQVYIHTNSILKVCEKLKNRNIRYHEISIELFQAFRPMLCERCDIHNLIIDRPHFVETKMDGERFQLHYKDGSFKYFSRNGYDYSDIYGESPEVGHFTSTIKKQLSPDLQCCILDGEMMGWHVEKKKLVSKGANLDVKKLRIGSSLQPCFCVFDILMYNDSIITNRPLTERIEIIKKVFTPLDGILIHVFRTTISNNQEAFDCLNNAIDNNEEGIIIKDPSSVYIPNSRKSEWKKLKPDYSEGTVDLDLLIIGGYYGSGRKKGMICHFLLGVASESNGEPEVFMSVARASSGISDNELEELSEKLNPYWIKFKGEVPPFMLLKREKPDVYIRPQNSVILQVKSPEVVRSDFYYTDYTLRFVRVEQIRYDKLWSECLTNNEFTKLRTNAAGKLTAGHILPGGSKRKRKFDKNDKITIPVAKVEKLSDIFQGCEICVMNGDKDFSKEELEKLVKQHGGSPVQHPNSSTFCVLFGEKNVRVGNVIKSKNHNVANISWLLNCIKEERLIPWNKQNLVCCNLRTEVIIAEQLSSLGSNENEPLSKEALSKLFESVVSSHQCSPEEMKEIDDLLFNGISSFSLFRNCFFFFETHEHNDNINANVKNSEIIFKFHAGIVCKKVNRLISHIIMDENCLKNLIPLKELCYEKNIFPKFVSYRWIIDSFENKKICKEDNYTINRSVDET